DDPGEVAEVGGDVDREAVLRHEAGHAHPDGGDLGEPGPHAGLPGDAVPLDAVGRERAYERLLEVAQVPDDVGAASEADDRVTDELAGTVVGDHAAAVRLEHLDAARGQRVAVPEHVL